MTLRIIGVLSHGFIALAVLLAFYPVAAQPADLLEVYRLAIRNDATYLAGFNQYEASGEGYKQARGPLLPSLMLSATKKKTDQDVVSSDNAVFARGSTDFDTDDITVSLEQSLYNHANWMRLRQAEAQLERVGAEWLAVQQNLMLRVAEAYFTVLTMSDNTVSIAAEEKAVEAQYKLFQASQQLASQTDLLDAEARLLQVRARAIDIRSKLRDSVQMLREMVGVLPPSLAGLKNELPLTLPDPEDPEPWLTAAQKTNPELQIRRHAVAVADLEIKSRRAIRYPTLALRVNYNDNDTGGTLFGGGSQVETQDIELLFNVPLYSGGVVSSRVREALSLSRRAANELTLEERAVQRQTYAALDGVISDISRTAALQKSVEAYEQGVRLKKISFNSGRANNLAVLDAERDLFFARFELAEAQYGYLLNTLRLKRAVGVLSENDLMQLNAMLTQEQVPLSARIRHSFMDQSSSE